MHLTAVSLPYYMGFTGPFKIEPFNSGYIAVLIKYTGQTCVYNSHIYSHILPHRLRLDKGTETGVMATIHCYQRNKVDDVDDAIDTILYGPSAQNKIERWWQELLERLEQYFKEQ